MNIRSDFRVELVRNWGSDRDIVEDAQALEPEVKCAEGRVLPVLRALLARKIVHTSPFEHSGMSVYVDAPAVVWWEWTRHRFMPQCVPDNSFNLESGRYKVLRPDFYVPPPERPIREPEGFKPMAPHHGTDVDLTDQAGAISEQAFRHCWLAYQDMLEGGVAREVARNVLGPAIYYAGRVSGGVLTWLHFLALRTKDNPVQPSSYPQWEIEQVANACERLLAVKFPLVYAVWLEYGRRTP